MMLLAWLVFSFLILQFLVSFTNLLFIQKIKNIHLISPPKVSILIPARNEEKNISTLLNDLINQNYSNFEVLVFNDQSSDRTAEIVTEISEQDSRIRLFHSEGLPSGWLGKNYACYSLAKRATGDFLLFLDADVRIRNDIVEQVVSFSLQKKTGLISVFPQQILITTGEKITIPLMNFILLTLLPLVLVYKSKFSSLAAANGQFMLFNSEVYKKFKPHEKMKNNKVEDIEIARYLKSEKIKIACLSGKKEVSCRMYNGFAESINGFSKNVICFFGNSFLLTILFWLTTTFGFILVYIYLGKMFLLIYLFVLILTRILVSMVSKQNICINLFYFIPQQLAMGIIIYVSLINKMKKQYEWKGRKIT